MLAGLQDNPKVFRLFYDRRSEMPKDIDREEVQRLLRHGAQLLEVLPSEEYQEAHLPEAINIPLKILNAQTARQLQAGRPAITYCHDFQ